MLVKSKASRFATTSKTDVKQGLNIQSVPAADGSTRPVRRSSISTRAKQVDKASDTLQEVLNRLRHGNPLQIALDVETSGLSWQKNHIVGYVCTFSADPRDSYYIPFRHKGKANVGGQAGSDTNTGWNGKLAPGEAELVKELDRLELLTVGHNIGFDLKFLSRVGYTMQSRFEDSMLNAALIDEFQGKFSLEFCANRAGVAAKKVDAIRDHIRGLFPEATDRDFMGYYWRLSGDDPIAVEYAAGDGTTTWQLKDKQTLELKNQELLRVWDVESRLIPVLARMTVKGIKIDVDYLKKLKIRVEADLEKLAKQFPPEFSTRSPTNVRAWMEQHGHTDWPLTAPSSRFPNGQPSFPETYLEKHSAGQQIVKVRKLSNLKDSFIVPLLETHIWNGRVHPNYSQLRNDDFGTISGRLSADSPNIQQIPAHNRELSTMFRKAFVPDKGMIWGHSDFSQMEPRLLAYYSRCKVLLDGYRATPPIDAHTAVAAACNKDWPTMTVIERKHYRDAVAKRINMTVVTGGGKGVLVSKYGLHPNEVDRFWNDYHRAMPEVRIIQKRMERRMLERGYIITLLGRRCRLRDRNKAYVATNRALQGGNADCIKLKLVECDEYLASIGRPIDMLVNCHDSIEFQFREEHRYAFEECLRIMAAFGENDTLPLDVPMVVDVKEGSDWALATFGADK